MMPPSDYSLYTVVVVVDDDEKSKLSGGADLHYKPPLGLIIHFAPHQHPQPTTPPLVVPRACSASECLAIVVLILLVQL